MTHVRRGREAPALTTSPARTPAAVLAWRAALAVLAAAVLFFCYWRQSQAAPLSSDGSANVLQAWDMLHGNLLLRQWWVSDVPFWTTELPQYMLIEVLTGLGPWVVHVGAAMTYTLLVLLAAVLARGVGSTPSRGDSIPPDPAGRPPREGIAKGNARGGAGLSRALLAAGLMLAPQLSATSILLLSPDHIGTAVPLLVIWLLIDRVDPGGRPPGTPGGRGGPSSRTPLARDPSSRTPLWCVPVLVCLLFTWTMVADSIVLLTGIVPLVLVAAGRALAGLVRRGGQRAVRWYELSLAGAAAVAGVAGSLAPKAIVALGGFHQSPVGADTDLSQLRHGAWVTLQAFLELFGANVFNTSFWGARPGLEVVFVALHLAGAVAAACGLAVGLARIFRFGELIVPVFAVAIVLNLGAYMISTHAQDLLGAREMAGVLPLGAVLAGRVLGDRLAAWTRAAKGWFVPVLGVLAAGYLATLGYGAAQAPVPAANQTLASWLVAHRLTDGLAGYWQANSTTVDSRRQVVVSAVVQDARDRLRPYHWETDDANFDPARHYANFVVADGPSALPGMQLSAELTFGRPQQTYRADGYTILVWDKNLLADLGGPGLT